MVIVFLLVLVLLVLFLVAVISLPPYFSMKSSSHCIDVSTLLFSMLASPLLPSFLDTYCLPMSSLGCNALCMIISFLVLWSICLSSSLIHFMYGLEYLMRGTLLLLLLLLLLLSMCTVQDTNCLWYWGSSSRVLGHVDSPLCCFYSQVHSDQVRYNVLGSLLWGLNRPVWDKVQDERELY